VDEVDAERDRPMLTPRVSIGRSRSASTTRPPHPHRHIPAQAHTHAHRQRQRHRHRQRHGHGHAAGEFPAYQPPRCKTAYSSHTIRRIRYIRPCRRRFRCAVRAHWCGEEGVQGPGAGWGIDMYICMIHMNRHTQVCINIYIHIEVYLLHLPLPPLVGLFGHIVGLFCRIVGLFCRIVGLLVFSRYRQDRCVTRLDCCKPAHGFDSRACP